MSAGRHATIALPLYLLIERRGPPQLPGAMAAAAVLPEDAHTRPRRCLLAYRTRQSAAAWVERTGGHLKPLPVLSDQALDRVAIVSISRLGCSWLALEPERGGLGAELVIDLRRWLADRQPLADGLIRFCDVHQLALPR